MRSIGQRSGVGAMNGPAAAQESMPAIAPMSQVSSIRQRLPEDFDHHVILFPTRSAAHVLAALPDQPGGALAGPPVGVLTQVIGGVTVFKVGGPLGAVAHDLDRAIQMALTSRARGVVADLSAVFDGPYPTSVGVLATAGRHVRDWPGIPVAVACPDPRVRVKLADHPLGRHLIVAASLPSALSKVRATPTPAVEWLRLAPHPTAPRASRNFVTRILLDWGLDTLIRPAGLVVHELVANSMHAGTDIDVSVAWNLGKLRLTIRDNGPDLPLQTTSPADPYARRLSVVALLSRAFGVLPTADGGKVVWAVLNDARALASTNPGRAVAANSRAQARSFSPTSNASAGH